MLKNPLDNIEPVITAGTAPSGVNIPAEADLAAMVELIRRNRELRDAEDAASKRG